MNLSEIRKFLVAYVKSMRLYYGFITGIAGWLGVSFYYYVVLRDYGRVITTDDYKRSALVLGILFASWGINQIFNDWLGLEEDRRNAPHRPMVTGELNVKWALIFSGFLMSLAAIITYFLNPHALVPMILGFLLNFVYEYSKAWGLWGNVIFGIMIANCTVYGFLASGPTPSPLFTRERLSALFLVALMNGLMTYFTYFKDYKGDRAAKKDTFIVRHGLKVARVVGIIGSFLPTFFTLLFKYLGLLTFDYTEHVVFCGTMTIFLQIWTAIRFYRHPIGPKAYFSNATNFRACVSGQITLIAMFNGTLALYLFSFSYVFIGFLFGLHEDEKS